MYVRMYVCMYVCMYGLLYACVFLYMYMCVCMYLSLSLELSQPFNALHTDSCQAYQAFLTDALQSASRASSSSPGGRFGRRGQGLASGAWPCENLQQVTRVFWHGRALHSLNAAIKHAAAMDKARVVVLQLQGSLIRHGGPKQKPHKHKDPTEEFFWNPPHVGP